MRTLAYVLMGIFTFLIQSQLFPTLFYQSWLPNLILVWIILIAMIKNRRTSLLVAVIGGGVHDIIISNFFGIHFFPYLLTAYLVFTFRPRIYEEQWYMSCLVVFVATFIDGLIRVGVMYLLKADITPVLYLWHMVWPAMWANTVLAFFVHEILWNLEEREEYIW